MLSGVDRVDLAASLLGVDVRAPIFVAPMAYQGTVHEEGERATARGAQSAGVVGVFSTLSSFSLEDIARATPEANRWFQLYLQPEVRQSRELVERAELAGYRAVVLTVDVPILGVRDGQSRHGFVVDAIPAVGNGPEVRTPERPHEFARNGYRLRSDASQTWDVLDAIREWSGLPLIVKGVLTPEDARKAVAHGARAVIVSNHGGRQLDGAPASLEALPAIVAAVGDRAEVYLDSGVRRGSDVAIALALGARAVGVGRPVLWALAAGGEAGVARYLELLQEELAVTLALLGRASVRSLDRDSLAPSGPLAG